MRWPFYCFVLTAGIAAVVVSIVSVTSSSFATVGFPCADGGEGCLGHDDDDSTSYSYSYDSESSTTLSSSLSSTTVVDIPAGSFPGINWLFLVAGLVLGIWWLVYGGVGLFYSWGDDDYIFLKEQVKIRTVWTRWIVWAVVDGFLLAYLAILAGFTATWSIVFIAALGSIALNFTQSYNEVINADEYKPSSSLSAFSTLRPFYGLEGWVVAFIVFLFLAIGLFSQRNLVGIDTTESLASIWFFVGAYGLLHLLILVPLTNFFTSAVEDNVLWREFAFVLFRAIIIFGLFGSQAFTS